jgi:hypothetical protein
VLGSAGEDIMDVEPVPTAPPTPVPGTPPGSYDRNVHLREQLAGRLELSAIEEDIFGRT